MQVDVRVVWPHEALHFTPWLLANPDVLSAVLHMDLELQAAEHAVGDFSLDLVGVDTATGDRVIVENQLERSDHTHLGQILTYAGGTDPINIVWVAPGFREEHRAAIDWLNSRTDERTRFFAVELSVVQIGNSQRAPLLKLVAAPNDWEKSVKTVTNTNATSQKSLAYQQFWQLYLDEMHNRKLAWTTTKIAPAQNWINLSAGVSGVYLGTSFSNQGLRSEIYFGAPDAALNQHRYDAATAHKTVIEQAYGGALSWEPLPERKGSRIADYAPGSIQSTTEWSTYVEWFLDTQTRLRHVINSIGGIGTLTTIPLAAAGSGEE